MWRKIVINIITIFDYAAMERRAETRLGEAACRNLPGDARKQDEYVPPGATPQCERRPCARVLKVHEKGGRSAWYVVGKRLPKDAEGPPLVSQSVCHRPDTGTPRRGNGEKLRWTCEGCKMHWERRPVSIYERT